MKFTISCKNNDTYEDVVATLDDDPNTGGAKGWIRLKVGEDTKVLLSIAELKRIVKAL
mgnify:CR=1 FL=1|jgi:hypothetical protein